MVCTARPIIPRTGFVSRHFLGQRGIAPTFADITGLRDSPFAAKIAASALPETGVANSSA